MKRILDQIVTCRLRQKQIIRVSKITQQVSNTQGPAEDCVSQDRIKQRTVEQVVNMHAQHDVHTVKMGPSRRRSIWCDAKPSSQHSSHAETVEEQSSERCPCRYATTDANDAKGTEYQRGEPREDFPRCSTSTKLSKIQVTMQMQVQMMQKMLKEQKEHLDTLCVSTDQSTRESQWRAKPLERRECRQREDSR